LKDERRRVKINACRALADKDGKVIELNERITKSIAALRLVAEEDVDGFVRRNAEVNLNLIREWLKEWTNTPPKLEIKMRKNLEVIVNKIGEDEKTRIDEGKGKTVTSENYNKYEKIQKAAGKERLEY
jgi:hypothetical protein